MSNKELINPSKELELWMQSQIHASNETIKEETQRLMKEYSLSYGEARVIATNECRKILEKMLNDQYK